MEADMFGAGQQVMTPEGLLGRIVALAGDRACRRIYVGDVCVPASVVLFECGAMRWFADRVLQPLAASAQADA
jgi:hypothetical protein